MDKQSKEEFLRHVKNYAVDTEYYAESIRRCKTRATRFSLDRELNNMFTELNDLEIKMFESALRLSIKCEEKLKEMNHE